MKRGLMLLLIPALLTGCVTTKAKTPVERPNLDVPPPPPRLVEPMTPSEPPPPDPVADLPASPAATRPRPATPQKEPAKPEPPKTEPIVEQPAVAPPVAPPLPQLRTPTSPDTARQGRESIDRANAMLNSIDYRVLSNERKAQYDNAKLLINQAEDAVKASNFDFAKNLADKAERIARELQGR